jgi:hypothetical protein
MNPIRDHPGDLAVVSTYFNPCGYKSRVRNHEAFREYMNAAGVRHICVELVFNAQAEVELKPGADLLLIRGGDVMWQKERLAILGIYRLFAEGFNKVLVADGDIRFERDDWARLISDRLNAFDCVQAFEIARCRYSEGERRLQTIFDADASPRDTHPGSAWAYTRAFLDLVGLFDKAIIGGADRLMSFVWLDLWRRAPSQWPMRLGLLRERLRMSDAYGRQVLAWARRGYRSESPWRFGYVPGLILSSATHGSFKDRAYFARYAALEGYDPETDVQVGPSGAFMWASNKPAMHIGIKDYFASRREDLDATKMLS